MEKKWTKIEDEPEILNKHSFTLPDGRNFEVGIHPVIFGFRIVGSYQGHQTYELNWCCGDKPLVVQATQQIVMKLIQQGTPLKDIPFCSEIKPWPNDKEFIQRIGELMHEPMFPELVETLTSLKVA